jgi:hypothetical protein
MSEMSGTIDNGWTENAALLEKRANTAEKQVAREHLLMGKAPYS